MFFSREAGVYLTFPVLALNQLETSAIRKVSQAKKCHISPCSLDSYYNVVLTCK